MGYEVYDFGLRLKQLRENAGFTQQTIANKLEVSVGSIKNYEKNTQLPPVDKLETMALLYKTSLDYLRNLNKRKAVYIDDLSPSRQKLVLEIIDSVRNEQKNSKRGD